MPLPDYAKIFADLPELRTGHLRLRRLCLDDAEAIYAYGRDPDVSRYTTWETHVDLAAAQGFLQFVLSRYAAGEPESWGVELLSTGALIGTVALLNWDRDAQRMELGYTINPLYSGQGYATEAAQTVLDFAFEVLQMQRVVACCMAENLASERVMQKLGMHYEGCFRKHYWKRGRAMDLKFYAAMV